MVKMIAVRPVKAGGSPPRRKGVIMDSKIKETLEKQLQLLSERSNEALPNELAELSRAMVEIAELRLRIYGSMDSADFVSPPVKEAIR